MFLFFKVCSNDPKTVKLKAKEWLPFVSIEANDKLNAELKKYFKKLWAIYK